MKGVKLVFVLCIALLAACARQPAQCERPLAVKPEAPRTDGPRRLAATIADDGGCHVKLRLPDSTTADEWPAARDSALASAEVAARTCCAQPRATNVTAWAVGTTSFEVAFDCARP